MPEIAVSSTVTLDSNGRAVVLSGGNHANRVLQVTSGGNLTVKGLTVANGLAKGADGTGGVDAEGGGVIVGRRDSDVRPTPPSPTIRRSAETAVGTVAISGRRSRLWGRDQRQKAARLNLLNSTVANNTSTGRERLRRHATRSKAASETRAEFTMDTNSSVTLTNSTIAGNHAIGGNAGPSSTGNSHGGDATNAGIHVGRSTATLLNVTVVEQRHDWAGSGQERKRARRVRGDWASIASATATFDQHPDRQERGRGAARISRNVVSEASTGRGTT